MAQLETLEALIIGTDLARYSGNDALLNYALSYAQSEILKRRSTDTLEGQYLTNQIEGAKWYLSHIGAEGTASISENGVSTVWKEVPEWLASIIPRIGVVHNA